MWDSLEDLLMACDNTYYARRGAIPLDFFRMLREERRYRHPTQANVSQAIVEPKLVNPKASADIPKRQSHL
jgi:hypothetical protein